jgi:Mu-like prophage I protein
MKSEKALKANAKPPTTARMNKTAEITASIHALNNTSGNSINEFIHMNLTTRFEPAVDGWFHMAPHGTFPHPTGAQQVIDAEACETMTRTFAEEAKQANFPGLLVDFDHFSHDPAQPSAAAGWVTALETRPEGLYAQVRWSDLGHQAVTGGRYRLMSPVWNRADCDEWTAPVGSDAKPTLHVRPRRLARVALTNDPNLPGLAPLTNRAENAERAERGEHVAAVARVSSLGAERREPVAGTATSVSELRAPRRDARLSGIEDTTASGFRTQVLNTLRLPGRASDGEIVDAVRRQGEELASLRNRCAELREAQADAELEGFADVITNRAAVRAQLLANREGTLAVLQALRRPEPFMPLHDPRAHRPNLHLLSPLNAAEAESGSARRIANRARQLQSQLKIGHQAAFRLAEGEDAA